MENTRIQHYVPQFYLKRWGGVNNNKVYVYDKFTGLVSQKPTKQVAQAEWFYDIPAASIKPEFIDAVDVQMTERGLSRIESDCSQAIAKFLPTAKTEGISAQHRRLVALFISIQSTRTPTFRKLMREVYEKASSSILEAMCEANGFPRELTPTMKFDDDMWPTEQGAYMFDPRNVVVLTALLSSRLWTVAVARKPLYTSDNPVIQYSYNEPPYDDVAFSSPGAAVAVPMSPDILLILRDPLSFPGQETTDGKPAVLSDAEVDYYNEMQVGQCYRQVFSSRNDFATAREVCKQHPEVCREDRQYLRTR